MRTSGSSRSGLSVEQLRTRLNQYEQILNYWRQIQSGLEQEDSDELQLDIDDLDSHRRNVEELYNLRNYWAKRRVG